MTDADRIRSKALDKFLQTLAATPQVGHPVTALVGSARLWLRALGLVPATLHAFARDDIYFSDQELLERLRRHYEPAFGRHHGRVVRLARKVNALDLVFPYLQSLSEGIESCERWMQASVIQIHVARTRGIAVDAISLRAMVEQTLTELEYLSPALVVDDGFPPLTPREQEIWDLLDGQALQGKQLARCSGDKSGDAERVRKVVEDICLTGRCIKNRRTVGYYRPDALPASS